jgi:hypothetical protein
MPFQKNVSCGGLQPFNGWKIEWSVRRFLHCKISQLVRLNDHKEKLTNRSQLTIITVSGDTFLLFS